MVAKTYTNWEQVGEPFESAGRKYVNVRNPKNDKIKQVRFYTEQEFSKIYHTKNLPKSQKSLKKVLGFEKGYITIFSNSVQSCNQLYFSKSNARWHKYWNWYIVSTENVPIDLPKGVKPYRLNWDTITLEDNITLKPENEIKKIIKIMEAA